MSAVTKENVVSFIENMSVLELSQFVKELEEKFGVSAAAPVAMMAGGAVAGAGVEAAAAKTEFTVVLAAAGDKKINVIKVVREITQLGLGEAKDLVEKAPGMIKKGVDKKTADDIKKKVEAAGGKVTLK